jgi:uncharacterized sulfatase
VRFIEANRDKPFFLQVSPFAVHIPLDTTPALKAKYEAKAKVPGYSCHPLYAGLLEELDSCVGTLLDALERHKLAENTLVIFTSDNGGLERESGGWPGTNNAPLRNEKGSLYEGGIRVPALFRWPGVTRPNSVTRRATISVDLYPTILEATRVKAIQEQVLDGVSLMSVLRDSAIALPREALYWHYPHYHHSRPSGAIRTGDWKAIEFFDTGEVELYDLRDDLGESKNLAGAMPDRAQDLRDRLRVWRRAVTAQMPQRNPAHDPRRAGEWWSRAKIAPTEAPGTYRPAGEKP